MKFNYNQIKKKNYCYIIAEAGVNHECSLAKAKKLIYLAKKGGADAIKFQTYKADKIVLKNAKGYWDTKKEKINNQHKLFSKYDKFEREDYIKLSKLCLKLKIDFLSTPFDIDSVNFLKRLVPAFKISSSDITNIPLLEAISKTRKPILLSTGASNISEIKNAIKVLRKNTTQIVIMHCILNYPTLSFEANLGMINDLKKNFPNYIIGYSDHTIPNKNMTTLTTAFLLGAKVIEKHFTLNKKIQGNDHFHSMDFKDLQRVRKNLAECVNLIGQGNQKKEPIKSEYKSRKFARRCIATKFDLTKGTILNEKNLITLRPNIGIPAENWKKIIGKKLNKNIKALKRINLFDISSK